MPFLTRLGFSRASARSYIFLSIAAAVATIGLKTGAYLMTGSVGLLSDAVESLVNLAAALVALWALTLADRPPDAEHTYGHSKAEYFASAAEGALILVAAAVPNSTVFTHLEPIEDTLSWDDQTLDRSAPQNSFNSTKSVEDPDPDCPRTV